MARRRKKGPDEQYCTHCGAIISKEAEICPKCGVRVKGPPRPRVIERKSTGLAAVLALILGFFGLWGVGHIYVGKLGRGFALLIIGVLLAIGGFLLIIGAAFAGGLAGLAGGAIFWVITIILLVGWIWQTFDAYNLAKRYNEYVYEHGRAPW